jgi:type II secretory pathway pseudopilin PulG
MVHKAGLGNTWLEHGCEMKLTTSRHGSTLVAPRKRRSGEAGFTLIDMLFVVGLIGILCSMAIPGLMRAKGAAQAASALGSIRLVNSAQLSFAITCGLGFYAPDFPTLGVPSPGSAEGYLPPEMSAGFNFMKSGYNFILFGTPHAGAPASCNGLGMGQAAPGYALAADVLNPAVSMPRFFGTNADGVIWEHISTLSLTMPEGGAPPVGVPLH